MRTRPLRLLGLLCIALLILGLLITSHVQIPVANATPKDWNHNTFWHSPWGSSGVHKGIDIFGKKGTAVVAPVSGVVLLAGQLSKGGKVIALLGPQWRVHYMAHLQSQQVGKGDWVAQGQTIGTLGDTGNAAGKAPHVHYSIVSLLPLPWKISTQAQGWKKMFYLNPHQQLTDH